MSKEKFELEFTQDDFMAGVMAALNENPEALNDQNIKNNGGRPAAIEAMIRARSKIGGALRRNNGSQFA